MHIALMIHLFDRLQNKIRTFPFVKKLGEARNPLEGGGNRKNISDSGKGGRYRTDYWRISLRMFEVLRMLQLSCRWVVPCFLLHFMIETMRYV